MLAKVDSGSRHRLRLFAHRLMYAIAVPVGGGLAAVKRRMQGCPPHKPRSLDNSQRFLRRRVPVWGCGLRGFGAGAVFTES